MVVPMGVFSMGSVRLNLVLDSGFSCWSDYVSFFFEKNLKQIQIISVEVVLIVYQDKGKKAINPELNSF